MRLHGLGFASTLAALAALAATLVMVGCGRPPLSLEDGDTGTDGGGSSADGDAESYDATGDDDGAEATSAPPGSRCGDGTVDPGEACDDGDARDGDGCNADCQPSGELLFVHEIPPARGDEHYPNYVMVAPDDTVTIAGQRSTGDGNEMFVAAWDAAGEPRFHVTLPHDEDTTPGISAMIAAAGGGVRIAMTQNLHGAEIPSRIFVLAADGEILEDEALSVGVHVGALASDPDGGWWVVGRSESEHLFVERRAATGESLWTGEHATTAWPREAARSPDGLVILADLEGEHFVLRFDDAGTAGAFVETECPGGLAVTSEGLAVVSQPRWDGEPAEPACILDAAGEAAPSPWPSAGIDGVLRMQVGPSDRLVGVGWIPQQALGVETLHEDGAAGWASVHSTDAPYLLPFSLAIGASGRIAVPAITIDDRGATTGRVYVFSP